MNDTQKIPVRSTAKYAITAGVIYGVVVLVLVFPIIVFSFGTDDSFLEELAICIYALSMLPASLCALRYPKFAGFWLISTGILSAFAMTYQEIHNARSGRWGIYTILAILWWMCISSIPPLLGMFFIRHNVAKNNISSPIISG